ncbi:hypothetical protein COV11_01375 [Candidatus Woesearchaeota archaeon CG10_big_fil_rev_8_21_14_0_10_30_7]|nr:MAG: hypothetical protein COV11_01375 [Candidatus Woesearchaeota archaeon CG10_big_fil_rev_8_21_14_0_10_30_7]
MSLKFPDSMDECAYFTRRANENSKSVVWVFKEKCPECKKGLMGKPRDPKTGKPKIRAKEYTCPECNHTVEKEEYEDTLTANIQYTCPECKHEGETQVSFKRKKVSRFNEEKGKKESVDAVAYECEKCKTKLLVTKKMK